MKIIRTQKVTLTAPVQFEVEIPDSQKQEFKLLYKRLDGQEKIYDINEIIYMDSNILKANTPNGYRSFRTNRIISMIPE